MPAFGRLARGLRVDQSQARRCPRALEHEGAPSQRVFAHGPAGGDLGVEVTPGDLLEKIFKSILRRTVQLHNELAVDNSQRHSAPLRYSEFAGKSLAKSHDKPTAPLLSA